MTWTDKTAFTGEAAAFAGELHDKLAALPSLALSTLDSESTALFVVDMVEGFARQGAMASPRVEALIAPIAALAGRCEAAGIPVVAFADTHAPDSLELQAYPPHCLRGTEEARLCPGDRGGGAEAYGTRKELDQRVPRAGVRTMAAGACDGNHLSGNWRLHRHLRAAVCTLRQGVAQHPQSAAADTGADGADGHLRRAGTPGRHAGGGSVVFDGGRRGGTIRRCRLIGHPFGTRKPITLGS